MGTTIYYFSATGNSLKLARDISLELGDTELISIPKAIKDNIIETSAKRIGIIFPVYAWGLPRLLTDFLDKLKLAKEQYIFAVTTCVAIPGNTLVQLKKILKNKGVDLHAGFVIKSGRSSLMKLNSFDKIIMKLDRKRYQLKTSENRLNEIVNSIKKYERHRPEVSTWSANIFGSMLHEIGIKSFKTKDKEFIVNENCKGCGNCALLCPRENITMKNNKPEFNNNCELCHACIQWCNNFAIRHKDFDDNPVQYHNPAIRLSDMLIRQQ